MRKIRRPRLRQLGHQQHQRRHQKRAFDPLLHHGLEQHVRQRVAHDDNGRSGLHGPDRPNRAADMEQRQADERAAALAHLRTFQRAAGTDIEQIPSGQHGAFRQPGRPRGAELRDHGAVGVASRVVAAARQVRERHGRHAGRRAVALELRPGDDQLRSDVVDDLLDLVRRQPPVERRRDQAGFVEREEQFEISRAVLVENADAIAGGKTELVEETGRERDVELLNSAKVQDFPSNHTASSDGCRRARQRSISAIVRIRAPSPAMPWS